MKFRFKHFGALLGLFTAIAHAQSLRPVGISADPSSAAPGDSVSYVITVNNGDTTQFGPGKTADFTLTLTNRATGAFFTVTALSVSPTSGIIGNATVDPQSGQTTPGMGTFTLPATAIPINTTEAGAYSATVTMDSVSAGVIASPTFTVSTTVLTVTGKPDLQITALTYPAGTSYVGGTVIPMTLTYRNNSATNGKTRNVPYTPGLDGMPRFVRIKVILSPNPTFGDSDDFQLTFFDITAGNFGSNPTFDNAGNPAVLADGSLHTFSWNQILPGNFQGSYHVMAKIDALDENDPPPLTVDGNNIWGVSALNPQGARINLLPSNFPATFLASHGTSATTSADGYSDNPSISLDGRYTAFASDATNLVVNDTNAARDIFIYDSQTLLVRRLSLSQQGNQGNGASNDPRISGNGRYVAFSSQATNLIVGDSNGFSDIYVVDVVTGLISRASVTTNGAQANNPSFRPAISATGRFIVFESSATNLDSSHVVTPGSSHIYLHDRDVANTGTFDTTGNTSTVLVDADFTTPATAVANGPSIQAAINAGGTLLAFASKGTNLVGPPGTTALGRQHVYIRPYNTSTHMFGATTLVSVQTGMATQGDADSQTPSLNQSWNILTNAANADDGHYVAFASRATDLVAGDTNGVSDIFVYDNTGAGTNGTVTRVSVTSAGAQGTDSSPMAPDQRLGSINPTISSDGRYVAFASLDDDLTDGDTNGQYQTTDANWALDVFVHNRDVAATGTFDTPGNIATEMVTRNTFGYQTNSLLGIPSTAASNIYPVISADGRYVAFSSDAENTGGLGFGATNLLPLDSNGFRDVFLHDRRTDANVTPPTPPIVTITSPGSANSVLVNSAIPITATATTTVGVVSSVEFFVDGHSLGTSTAFPYSKTWTPTAVGVYTLSALVTDSFGNVGVSSNVFVTVVAAPSVGVTNPVSGSSFTLPTTRTLRAVAAASNPGATITKVQFFANGASLGNGTYNAGTNDYSLSWSPAIAGTYVLTAQATDSLGTQTTSSSVSITINPSGGGGGGTAPAVAITSPADGATYYVGGLIALSATASVGSGLITGVEFFANGISIGTATTAPYTLSAPFSPTATGTYVFTAIATDSSGNQTTSESVTVTVKPSAPPTVSLTAPVAGTIVRLGTSVALSATASDTDGVVTSVKFNVNGTTIATDTSAPLTGTWTPTAGGIYRLTALAADDSGLTTTSSEVVVGVVDPTHGDVDTVYTGIYQGGGESGVFAFIASGGKTGTFIARSSGTAIYYYPDVTISNGAFSLGTNGASLSGNVSDTAASGTFEGGKLTFIGTAVTGTSSQVPAGLYTGSLSGRPTSTLSIIVASDGSLALYLGDGTNTDVGVLRAGTFSGGVIASDGSFTVTTAKGATIAGKIDPASGFLTATITGGSLTGSATGATSSGGTLSDGSLRNLSTRGQVGAGEKVLIAGFVVGGDTPKQVLIRAIGPGLSSKFGMTGVVANPRLGIFQGATEVAQNDDWATPLGGGASATAIAAAADLVGAFSLTSGSQDAVVLATLAPGIYTAQVNSVDSTTGIALVEVYDVDNHTPFSPQKVVNISTRGDVGTGDGVLIAGFVIDGSASKKVLIRASGPGLAAVGLSADKALGDPKLTLYRATTVNGTEVSTVVRENDDWGTGNSAALVAASAARSGAFAVAPGSKDAAILITLPPGRYTAQLSGAGTTTGVALVEVYEIQ